MEKDRSDSGLQMLLTAYAEMAQQTHLWTFLRVCFFPGKRKKLLFNLQGLSVHEKMLKLRGMPLSLAEKTEIR